MITPWTSVYDGETAEGYRMMELVPAQGVTATQVANVLYEGKKRDPWVFTVFRKRTDTGWRVEWMFDEAHGGEPVFCFVWEPSSYVDALVKEALGSFDQRA